MSRELELLNLRGVLTEALAFVVDHADKDEDPEKWTLTRELRRHIAALTASPQDAPEVLVRRDARGLIASVEVGGKTLAANPEYVLDASPQVQGVEAALRAALTRLLDAYDDSASEFEAADAAQQARDALAATPQRAPGVEALVHKWRAEALDFHRDGRSKVAEQTENLAQELEDAIAALASGPSGMDA
jgi:hypothetical protein